MRLTSLFSALLLGSVLALAPASSEASSLIGYWDFNGNYDRTAGLSGEVDAVFIHIGPGGSLGLGTPGSDQNLYGGSLPGQALEFYDLATVAAIGNLIVFGLDFSDHVSPEISFAYRKTSTVDAFFAARLDYNIGSGWVSATTVAEPTEEYGVFRYTFSSGVLDGLSNVAIRVHFEEALELNASLFFDNLQVTAAPIPELGTVALLGGAAVLFAAGAFRRRS